MYCIVVPSPGGSTWLRRIYASAKFSRLNNPIPHSLELFTQDKYASRCPRFCGQSPRQSWLFAYTLTFHLTRCAVFTLSGSEDPHAPMVAMRGVSTFLVARYIVFGISFLLELLPHAQIWDYQVCSQYVMPSPAASPFGTTVSLFIPNRVSHNSL